MISPGLPVLNVSQLAEHWPKWRQYFEIYVVAAYNNEIKDRQKLALFLHCLGPDGIELINGWFPQLKNFNSPSATKITFSEVWNRLHLHCQFINKPDQDQPKYIADANQGSVSLNVDVLGDPKMGVKRVKIQAKRRWNTFYVLHEHCVLHLLKFLPNEDWDSLKLAYPHVRHLITPRQTFSIDINSLIEHPFPSSREYYERIARRVTILRIGDVTSAELQDVCGFFTNVTDLEISRVCRAEKAVQHYLTTLCKVRKLIYDQDLTINSNTLKFLLQNKDTLQYLKVEAVDVERNFRDKAIKNCIGGLHNLKTLFIQLREPKSVLFSDRCFPNLEYLHFHIATLAVGAESLLERLDGSKLRSIDLIPKKSKLDSERFPVLKHVRSF